jgi:peptide/nickel transport system substrate-binding protein
MTASGPIINSFLSTSCDRKDFYGWPCDADLEWLWLSCLDATTDAQKSATMDSIAAHFNEMPPYIPIGNFSRPIAYRKTVGGILQPPVLVLWNVSKQRRRRVCRVTNYQTPGSSDPATHPVAAATAPMAPRGSP